MFSVPEWRLTLNHYCSSSRRSPDATDLLRPHPQATGTHWAVSWGWKQCNSHTLTFTLIISPRLKGDFGGKVFLSWEHELKNIWSRAENSSTKDLLAAHGGSIPLIISFVTLYIYGANSREVKCEFFFLWNEYEQNAHCRFNGRLVTGWLYLFSRFIIHFIHYYATTLKFIRPLIECK